MKKNILYTLLIAVFGFTFMTSCKKDREPAVTMSGSFSGSFEGKYFDEDTLASFGYSVIISSINDNKVKVEGKHFDTFEVLVTSNGLNVEPVSQSDPFLKDFIYIGDEKKVKFTYDKGSNKAEFIGTK